MASFLTWLRGHICPPSPDARLAQLQAQLDVAHSELTVARVALSRAQDRIKVLETAVLAATHTADSALDAANAAAEAP